MHEPKDELHKVTLHSESPTGCIEIELANLVHKINKNKTQEHLVTNQADQKCPGKLGATLRITKFLVYSFLQ